jgi:hypothetical protein
MDMHFLASRRCSWGDSSRSASAMLREDGAAPGVVPGAVVPGEPKLRPRFETVEDSVAFWRPAASAP